MSAAHCTTRRAVAYYRASTKAQEESIPQQKEWVAAACGPQLVNVVASFEDDGVPGGLIDDRPGLMALVAFCEGEAAAGRPVEGIVCWDADRFSRADSFRTAAVVARLLDAGTSRMLTRADGWIDWNDDTHRLLTNVKQDMTRAAYSKAVSQNVTRSAIQRVKRGQWVAGKAPYGYVTAGPKDRKRLAVGKAEEAEAVRFIFRQFAESADSLGLLANKLTEAGYPTPTGIPEWSRWTVRKILTNRVYLGEIRWNAQRRGKYNRIEQGRVTPAEPGSGKRNARNNDAQEILVVPGAHEPLTDEETFERCRTKLAGNRWARGARGKKGYHWVLRGLLHCGDCGHRMVGHHIGYHSYYCKTTKRKGPGRCWTNDIAQETVLSEVAEEIREKLTNPEGVAALEAEIEAQAGEENRASQARREALDARLDALNRDIEKATKRLLLTDDDQVAAEAGAMVGRWKQERDQVAAELNRHDAAAAAGETYTRHAALALARLRELGALIVSADPAEARDAIAGLVSKVTLYFRHEPISAKRCRNVYVGMDVELRPEVSQLLTTANSPTTWTS
jgi:site-specific DNA recombinase